MNMPHHSFSRYVKGVSDATVLIVQSKHPQVSLPLLPLIQELIHSCHALVPQNAWLQID